GFGLASVVVVQEKFRVSGQKRPAVLVVAVGDAGYGAYHLLGWNAVHLLRIDAHEILATARHDVSLVAIRTQVLEQLDHRKVRELRVGPLPSRVSGVVEPSRNFGLELIDAHIGERRIENLEKVIVGELRDYFEITRQHGLEWFDVRKLGPGFDDHRHTVQGVEDLCIYGMRDPQRAVLVESGNAVRFGHEL